ARQLAAEYIAAFLTVSSDSCAAVEGFIVRDNPDFASDEFDFYKILRYIDTDRSSEYITFASGVLGIGEWKEIIPDYRGVSGSGRVFHEKTIDGSLPDRVTGTVSLSAFENDDVLSEWTVSSSATSLSAQNDFKGYRNMLFAEYGALTPDSLCALTHTFQYKRDLSFAPYLSFNIYTDNLPPSVRSVNLTVTVITDGAVIEFTGPLRVGEWHYAICDLSDMSAAKSVKSLTFRLSAPDADLSGVRLVIGEIFASSLRYDNRFLETKFREERDKYLAAGRAPMNRLIVWILIGIIVTATVIEVINISHRVKRGEGEKKKRKKHDLFRAD
ncbi:MAG: hypothetical protein PHZ09_11105, partial [Eubacteriales bacterium]|nr:hypothetical protein [Eubacteriales bacterium]